jgi:hypothetical protein
MVRITKTEHREIHLIVGAYMYMYVLVLHAATCECTWDQIRRSSELLKYTQW